MIAGTIFFGTIFSITIFSFLSNMNATREANKYTASSVRIERFKLIDIDPPKHVYVNLESADGKAFNRVYVSKHCNGYQNNKLGDWYNLQVYDIMYSDGRKELLFNNLEKAFC